MSKVEVAGPRELLEKVLSLLRDTGILEIEASSTGFINKIDGAYIDSYLPDRKSLSEKLFLEDFRQRIEELLSYLPVIAARSGYFHPQAIIDTINETLQKHLLTCRGLHLKKEALQKEMAELSRYNVFLDAVEPLLEGLKESPDIDIVGLTLKDPDAEGLLRRALSHLTGDRYELLTSTAADGTGAGLITIHKNMSGRIKQALSDKHIPELRFPSAFGGLTFTGKVSFLKKRLSEISEEIDIINMQLDSFSVKWGTIYQGVREWIDERLSLLKATASVFVTRMCFFIYGWTASEDVIKLKERLSDNFKGKVVLEELEIEEEDLDRMPVILKNPPYFKPFELFTRILPLPRYTSYDPTPFIAIFFPVFFGMILGDAGYGLFIIAVSFVIFKKFREKRNVADACRILMTASLYSIFFGILYGEFFGEFGHTLFGLEPLFIERRTAVIPMLYFSVSVGVVHILIGSFLGLIKAMQRKTKKEALLKLMHISLIIAILALVASLFGLFPALMTRPVILAILIITPVLLFTGGLLAPLEVVKSIGNIISYARIMAIGLTSVLLAYVANHLAGMTGDIIVGTVVAGLLHLLNIMIGIFSPTIHSLRLHYVEFFNKFIEAGGRKFEPFRKKEEYR
ncbi:MAG: ATPase [Nitrospiraceae bacterium]|nr:MAG: ATPase [Nitrospiraceae bacterium]